jgi:membrane protease YdiL (CAAX protease family)
LQILGLGIITLIISNFLAQTFSKELIRKQKDEIVEKIKEEGLSISDVEENSQSTQENKKISNSDQNKSTKIPFYNISPVFSFITIVCLAPIIEECLFRYLIFESLGKKNSLAYIFSGASFIFFH